jgi:periplasmic protein TonB
MASPARIAKALPTTLPADFGEWDEGARSTQPGEAAPAQPAPDPDTTPMPALNAAPLPQAESPRNRFFAAQPKVYSSDKAFLDQLISMQPETGAPNRISAQHPASAGAIYEVVSPRPASSRSRTEPKTETRSETRNESRPDRSRRTRVEVGPVRPARRRAEGTQASDLAHEAFPSQPAEIAAHNPALDALGLKDPVRNRKRIVAIAAAAALVLALLLILAFAVGRAGRHGSGANPTEPQPASAATYSSDDEPKPSPAAPLSAASARAADAAQSTLANAAQTAAAAQPAPPPAEAAAQSQVESQMMNDQLSAPAKITPEMKSIPAGDAPPATLDSTGLGGSAPAGGVLSAQAPPQVQAAPPKIVNLSEGVAVGLLVQSTPPVYPSIAKAARVSGTVVLEATISKTGVIENLRVVTGPAMLRQSALDAVRTWRYRPYKVNNQPTAIDTTINVVFSLQR